MARSHVNESDPDSNEENQVPAKRQSKVSEKVQQKKQDELEKANQQLLKSDTENLSGPPSKKSRTLTSAISAQPSAPLSAPARLPIVLAHGTDLKKQPTLDDFADVKVQALLLRAAHEYEALICTHDVFPKLATRVQWAQGCFDNTQKDADADADGLRYEFTDQMLRLVCLLFLLILLLIFLHTR
ncbi:hypothetical protein H0H81_000606 [Sphagnurus paluster]|uniref:Uncharacterized protein n=1 Tax=Sphagnurus paluster TaxID=117069 RepID=A0A9P7FMU3_9AGAR|nr:hypothetical protein H0H81_000606 [Sphagnurus paluster]